MNITEANDLNIVLRYALDLSWGMTPDGRDERVPSEQAMEAAARLADKANKALGAGLTGERVRAAWPADEDEPLSLRDARDAERESAEADLNDLVWIHTTDLTACEHPLAVVTTDHQSGRCVMGRRIVRGEGS